ncbi:amidoligase family protein [Paenibacillus dokdonensis]|uniref:Amidoligase family protein n=1 Tax=Paenibacillus dokdonensis TaxID=2567944 RepID=A0ABU6GXR9_9BACL|nr:amidoligase family protein [Paenibacillus dokdonensis]MEC0244154.1 amidoligase family protein [Paenibacillus dokdonensis]
MAIGFRDLTFGVEIEFSGITREHAAQILVKVFGTTFARFGGWDNEEFHIPDPQDRIWKVEKDGSVDAARKEGNTVIPATDDYKCEMVSPILEYPDLPILLGVVEALKWSRNVARLLLRGIIGVQRVLPLRFLA